MDKYKDLRIFSFYNGGKLSEATSAEYEKRYNSISTIRLPFSIKGKKAFVVYNSEMLAEMSAIYQLNSRIITELGSVPKSAYKNYIIQSLIDEIQQSNEYENVESTRQEVEEAYEHVSDNKKNRFSGMVNKYDMLISQKNIKLATSSDVRALYDEFILNEVVRENANDRPDGEIFRKDKIQVAVKGMEPVHEGLYPESVIIETMDWLLEFLNDGDIDLLVRVSIFHFVFGYIHPFYNGNGRMARFISSYKLSDVINLAVCLRMSYTIKENRTKYQRMFKNAEDSRCMGDITRFTIDFLQLIHEACEDVYEDICEKKKMYSIQMRRFDIVLNNKLIDIAPKYRKVIYFILERTIFIGYGVTMEELIKETNVGKNTLNKILSSCGPYVYSKRIGRRLHWFARFIEE